MILKKVLEKYEQVLNEGNMHAHITNACYDICRHCYVDTVLPSSSKAKYVDSDDFLHFANLFAQGKKKINTGLSGGDPLAHPEILKILEGLNNIARVEILTSGLAFTRKNPNRERLIRGLAQYDIGFLVANPSEAYHSITWENIREIKQYMTSLGFRPSRFGMPSAFGEMSSKISEKISMGKPDGVFPIGRAKNLPIEQQNQGVSFCDSVAKPSELYIGYGGNLQYCLYTVHDGFMNIGELRNSTKKNDAINLVLDKLSKDVTFRDVIEHERCYFSKKIRKK